MADPFPYSAGSAGLRTYSLLPEDDPNIFVSKTNAYAALKAATGLSTTKAIAYAGIYGRTGLSVTKVTAYAVLENLPGLNVRKAQLYAVLQSVPAIVIVPMPLPAPKTLEFFAQDTVGTTTSPFTAEQRVQDWRTSWLEASVTLPPLTKVQAHEWIAFFMKLRGRQNFFQMGDPTATSPRGSGSGLPQVLGSGQRGYSLATTGWTPSAAGVLLPGDWLQIGYRLYRTLDQVDADGSGDATIHLWPNLREAPGNGTAIVLTNTRGLFRLKSDMRKWSVSDGLIFGCHFDAREAL